MFRRSAVALAFALSSCSAGTVAVGVTVPATGSSGQALSDPAASPAPAADEGGASHCVVDGRLAIARVRILLNEVELEGGGSRGPFVVTLSGCELQTGVAKAVALADFSAGHYRKSELEIEPPEDAPRPSKGHGCEGMKKGDKARGHGAAKAEAKRGDRHDEAPAVSPEVEDFQRERASILVDGRFDGRPFTFAARVKAEQESETGLDVKEDGPAALDLAVDPTGWFKAEDGRLLDPNDPGAHAAIARSLCLGLDRDLDGEKHEGKRAKDRCAELPLKR